jgi:hypothetical protein
MGDEVMIEETNRIFLFQDVYSRNNLQYGFKSLYWHDFRGDM